MNDALVKRINPLREEKRALILAHNSQHAEVQDIAEFCGDSWGSGGSRLSHGRRDHLRPTGGEKDKEPGDTGGLLRKLYRAGQSRGGHLLHLCQCGPGGGPGGGS